MGSLCPSLTNLQNNQQTPTKDGVRPQPTSCCNPQSDEVMVAGREGTAPQREHTKPYSCYRLAMGLESTRTELCPVGNRSALERLETPPRASPWDGGGRWGPRVLSEAT